ncbi:hypothetical protein A2U01_0033480, partial [Trifolium medium]|nr:hypothetical protein [Trifolium medium]
AFGVGSKNQRRWRRGCGTKSGFFVQRGVEEGSKAKFSSTAAISTSLC